MSEAEASPVKDKKICLRWIGLSNPNIIDLFPAMSVVEGKHWDKTEPFRDKLLVSPVWFKMFMPDINVSTLRKNKIGQIFWVDFLEQYGYAPNKLF